MSVDPIIGGNWATTEPRYREPKYKPSLDKLGYLNSCELDTLDALFIANRASSVWAIMDIQGSVYDISTIRKTLDRLVSLRCVSEHSVKNIRGKNSLMFTITEKGRDAFNLAMDFLIKRMEKRGCGGIRS